MKVNPATIETALQVYLAQGLTHAEIGARLQPPVAASTVAVWCRRFGLPPAAKHRRKFLATYGPDALDRLETLLRSRASLRTIGNVFNVSPEAVRLWRKLFFPHLPRRAFYGSRTPQCPAPTSDA